mmetsp:Transcript_110786/g.226741  ORF Transcript_110786/g.226741 Transcript_110786/m.226741 type:complete len:127 (-) Transcript_110786:30-410(-)
MQFRDFNHFLTEGMENDERRIFFHSCLYIHKYILCCRININITFLMDHPWPIQINLATVSRVYHATKSFNTEQMPLDVKQEKAPEIDIRQSFCTQFYFRKLISCSVTYAHWDSQWQTRLKYLLIYE